MNPEIEKRFRDPAPGSAMEAARDFGIDLTLLIERLRLSPTERVRQLEEAMKMFAQIQGAAQRRKGALTND